MGAVAGCPGGNTMQALVAGTLSEGERAAVANHAASCDQCHALIEGLIATGGGRMTGRLEIDRGARVGRYVIGEQLGSGGMGVVHAALDSELRRRVAVKFLRPDRHGHVRGDGRERLMREARTLARLAHPNVVTVFDVGTHDGHLFVAMELVDGGSLSAWLRRAPRSTGEIIGRMVEAGRGLAAAHAAGIVHRDVKPDNILIDLEGGARMTDFGLAQLDDAPPTPPEGERAGMLDAPLSLTRTGTLVGTPAYMAPEHLLRGETGARTDQWSFCVTLYEALAGVRPFVVDDIPAHLTAIAGGRLAAPVPGRRVPGWVRKIVTRGLSADPDARWPSMDALVRELVRRRHRSRHAAIAGVVAVGSLVAGASLPGRGEPAATDPPASRESRKLATAPRWVDLRPGCNCPYSACKGGCVSVCGASGYMLGQPVPGINAAGRQDILLGASADGDTILYLTGPRCDADRLMLARRRGSTFESVDLTDRLDLSRVAVGEGCCTLSADGEAVVMTTADRTRFARSRLAGFEVLPADDAEFRALIAAPGRSLRFPVLAADELTLYYRLDDPGPPGDVGPQDGSHAAVRADRWSPFSPGRRVTGKVRQYEYITGVSSDGLSLFVASDFETSVLVRTSTAEPFGPPAWTLSPARLDGWRALPLSGCDRILTTSTPGGCEGEDIIYLEALAPVPKPVP
jgi:hypothetical protein